MQRAVEKCGSRPSSKSACGVDEDVLAFFKAHGPRYQTRINAVLRAYVDAHKE